MNAIGGQELELTALQDKTLWEKTGRWSDEVVDVWFKTRDDNYGLGFTHEEPLTQIMTEHISSYRDLPVYVYQFQTKFRNEARAKSGIMRGREFLMKDLYSFSRSVEEHEEFYNKVKGAYEKVFERAGIGDRTYFTTASGGSFGDKSHEFQCVSEAGEDTIYITDKNKKEAINKEIGSEGVEKKAVEVGNIFPLGTKFSEALELCFKDEEGNKKPVIMGSYGIGVSRLMGVIAEVFSDERGLIWNKEVSPFQVHLLAMSRTVLDKAEEVYKKLVSSGVEVLYDDRDLRAGEKFADADLIGIPTRVVVGNKYKESGKLEVKERTEEESKEMTLEEFNAKFI